MKRGNNNKLSHAGSFVHQRRLFINLLLLMVISTFGSLSWGQVLQLTEEEKAYIASHPTITASNEMDWPPFNYNEHRVPKGYSIEYMELAAAKVGLQVDFISGPSWDDFMGMVRNKELDVILNISRTPDRVHDFLFTEPYLISVPSILVAEGSMKLSNLEELNGKTVAVPKGFDFHELLLSHYPDINVLPTRNAQESLEAVMFHNADATIADLAVADYISKEYSFTGIQAVAKVTDANFTATMGMGVNKDHAQLRNILQKGMDRISDEETFKLRSKWINSFQKNEVVTPTNISLNEAEIAYLQAHPEITMCIDPKLMPYEEIDDHGIYRGITADFFKVFEEQLGVSFRIVKTKTWPETLQKAKNRECNIISLARSTRDRREYLNFTQPYITSNMVIATRSDVKFILDVASIKDKSIGMVKNYSSTESFKNKYPALNIVEVNSVEEGLEMVKNEELFGMVSALTVIGYALRQDYMSDLKISGSFEEEMSFSIGVRNDDLILLDILNVSIAMVPDETRRAIHNSWAPIEVKNIINFNYLRQIVVAFLLIIFFIVYRQRQLRKYNNALITLSTTDKLTNLPNRSKLDDMLTLRYDEFMRYKQDFSVVLIDIDKFKNVNDTYGHQAGDNVLIQAAEIIQKHSRKVDCAGRWGGEEFLVICPNTDQQGACVLAETMRKAFEGSNFGLSRAVTISAGVAEIIPDGTVSQLISRADEALYKAKEQGRNQVVTSESTGLEGAAVNTDD